MKSIFSDWSVAKRIGLILSILCFPFSVFVSFRCSAQEGVIGVRAGKIITVTGDDITNGTILIRNGKISQVGTDVKIPAGAKVLDASNKVVIPGLIDASTTLIDGPSDDRESVFPSLMAKDGFDFFNRRRAILAGGVTTVYVSPGQRRLISGQGFVVKLAGDPIEQRILNDNCDMMINIGEASKKPPAIFAPPIRPSSDNPILPARKQFPLTRMGEFAVLRDIFAAASIYQRAWGDFEQKERGRPAGNLEMDALKRALNREVHIRVNCHVAGDILKAINLADEFNLDLILENATEAYKVVEEISRRKIPVILDGIVKPGKFQREDNTRNKVNGAQKLENAAILAKAGVKIALRAPSDVEIRDLQLIAGYAARYGLSAQDALKAITINPAEILCVSDRVGAIAVGKDADLVILNAEPFDLRAFPEATLVNGKIVYKRPGTDIEFYPIEKKKEIPENLLVIRAGKILTVTQGQIDNGIVLIEGSKISYVGKEISVPLGAKVIDAPKSVVLPGMIDMHTHVGLHAESGRGVPSPSITRGSSKAYTRVINAVVPQDEGFHEILSAGVTSVLISPGDSSLVTGQAALIKLSGNSLGEMVIKEPAGIKFCMSRDSLGRDSRAAQLWKVRDTLKKGKEYSEKWDEYESESASSSRRVVARGAGLPLEAGFSTDSVGQLVQSPAFLPVRRTQTGRLPAEDTLKRGLYTSTTNLDEVDQAEPAADYTSDLLLPLTSRQKSREDQEIDYSDAEDNKNEADLPNASFALETDSDGNASEKKSEKEEKQKPEKPKKDENLEPFRKLFHHEVPALVRITRADEIVNALRLFKDEFELDVILIQGDDGYRVAEEIRKRDVPVAVGPNIIKRERGEIVNNAGVLSNAGVKVAFQTSTTSGARYLPLSAAWAVRYGMNPVEALKAVTIHPAEMLKVADRLGSIEKGKDADLVIMSGEPFDLTSRVERVIVNGRVVFENE